MKNHLFRAGLLTAAAAAAAFLPACRTEPGTIGGAPDAAAVAQAIELLEGAAERARQQFANATFEEWQATVYREPEADGKFIVNGDTPINDEKALRDFFERNVQESSEPLPLVVHTGPGDVVAAWNRQDRRHLSYCVATTFGARHQTVVDQMAAATGAWELAADVDFIHDPAQDASCTAANTAVMFDVRPVDVAGQYLARAFFPNETRPARNVLIDNTSFELGAGEALTLTGILRHELGHTLGYRHEHTRPQSGRCCEDLDWRPLTSYDAFSVMPYPQCNGLGDWSLTLTHLDRNGAACLYGPATGFTIDATVCSPVDWVEEPPGAPVTIQETGQTVAAGELKRWGPFAVATGSLFNAVITGTGDPDLYVRFTDPPSLSAYHCRPFTAAADETCSLDVPARVAAVHVMVRGYAAGTFDLMVTHTPPAP